jgi:hypothetical protein
MYATVRNYAGMEGMADALVEHEDDVKSLITAIDGFRAYYLIKTSDGAISISVYDDESGAEESTRQAGDWTRENLPDVATGSPQVSAGEVVIQA